MVDKLAIAKRAQAAGVTVTRVQTVAQWYTTYLDKVAAPKVRASTLANYEYEYRLHIALAIGRLRLDRLEPAHLASLYEAKLASGLSHQRAPAARQHPARAERRRQVGAARTQRRTPRGPAPRQHHEVMPLTTDEARAFIGAASGDRLAARWVVGLSLGPRQGETLGLWWEDIDLVQGIVRVRRQLQRDRHSDGTLSFGALKTARSRRTLSLPGPLIRGLEVHRQQQEVERAEARYGWADPASSSRPRWERRSTPATTTGHSSGYLPEPACATPGCMTCDTPRRASCSPKASTPAWSWTCSATRRSR